MPVTPMGPLTPNEPIPSKTLDRFQLLGPGRLLTVRLGSGWL